MATNTNRTGRAYWERRLKRLGLGLDAGYAPGRVLYLAQTDFESRLSAEDCHNPDLMDIVAYKRDHLEAA